MMDSSTLRQPKTNRLGRTDSAPSPTAGKQITVILKGGLGNQLFQYAHGLRLQKVTRSRLQCVMSPQETKRRFMLRPFGIQPADEVPRAVKIGYNGGYQDNAACVLEQIQASEEQDFIVDGYFQHEAFFRDAEAEVRAQFSVGEVKTKARSDRFVVSVQIRLGDYLGDPIFQVCDSHYYRRAMDHFRQLKQGNVQFLVFSDQPELCASWVPDAADTTILPALDEWETFRQMRQCDGFVLSNSTFAWWGCYLARPQPNHVIVPSRWLNGIDWQIALDGWQRL